MLKETHGRDSFLLPNLMRGWVRGQSLLQNEKWACCFDVAASSCICHSK